MDTEISVRNVLIKNFQQYANIAEKNFMLIEKEGNFAVINAEVYHKEKE